MQQGNYSGIYKLVAKLKYTEIEQTICLFNEDGKHKNRQSANLGAALLRPPQDLQGYSTSALAYVISLEKVMHRDDALIVRLASI